MTHPRALWLILLLITLFHLMKHKEEATCTLQKYITPICIWSFLSALLGFIFFQGYIYLGGWGGLTFNDFFFRNVHLKVTFPFLIFKTALFYFLHFQHFQMVKTKSGWACFPQSFSGFGDCFLTDVKILWPFNMLLACFMMNDSNVLFWPSLHKYIKAATWCWKFCVQVK